LVARGVLETLFVAACDFEDVNEKDKEDDAEAEAL